ncbi:THO complex subunit 5B [Tanacetum coccineum]
MEYPLRPPFFTLNLFKAAATETELGDESDEWLNEMRAMEAEVVEIRVPNLDCQGCASKLKKAIFKLKGASIIKKWSVKCTHALLDDNVSLNADVVDFLGVIVDIYLQRNVLPSMHDQKEEDPSMSFAQAFSLLKFVSQILHLMKADMREVVGHVMALPRLRFGTPSGNMNLKAVDKQKCHSNIL